MIVDNNNTVLATLVSMVRSTPNDTDLGKKVRALISSMTESTNTDKHILKG